MLILLLLITVLQADQIPELKFTLNFQAIDDLKSLIIKPNFVISNKSVTIDMNIYEKHIPLIGLVDINIQNLYINEISLNLKESEISPMGNNSNRLYVSLNQINIDVEVDLNATVGKMVLLATRTRAIMNNVTITLQVRMDDVVTLESWGMVPVIEMSTVQIDQLNITFADKSIETKIASALLSVLKDLIPGLIKSAITDKLALQIQTMAQTTKLQTTVAMPTTESMYQFSLRFSGAPKIGFMEKESFMSMAVDIQVQNTITGAQCPLFNEGHLPDQLYKNVEDIEAIIGDNLLNQLLWLLIDSQVINIKISQKDLDKIPVDLPFALDTTGFKYIAPQFAKRYGDNKGAYVIFTLSPSSKPSMFFRSGRLVGMLRLQVELIIDTDSSMYPQTIADCTTCVTAQVLDTTLELMMTGYNVGKEIIAANIMRLSLVGIEYVSGEVVSDDLLVMKTLNSLLDVFVPQWNVLLNKGVKDTGLLGFKEININMGDTFIGSSLVWG